MNVWEKSAHVADSDVCALVREGGVVESIQSTCVVRKSNIQIKSINTYARQTFER